MVAAHNLKLVLEVTVCRIAVDNNHDFAVNGVAVDGLPLDKN